MYVPLPIVGGESHTLHITHLLKISFFIFLLKVHQISILFYLYIHEEPRKNVNYKLLPNTGTILVILLTSPIILNHNIHLRKLLTPLCYIGNIFYEHSLSSMKLTVYKVHGILRHFLNHTSNIFGEKSVLRT